MYALNSDPTQKRTAKIVHGIGRPRLNLNEVKSIALPLPPKHEQDVIFEEVEHLLSVIREVEKQVEIELDRADRLRQSILKKAFSGKLVPQDVSDSTSDT
jgi:type I restriction enzyme S subunit